MEVEMLFKISLKWILVARQDLIERIKKLTLIASHISAIQK